jgi:hypothetical protein
MFFGAPIFRNQLFKLVRADTRLPRGPLVNGMEPKGDELRYSGHVPRLLIRVLVSIIAIFYWSI